MNETRNHSICLYNTMVSSHQSHTWEQGPFYLSIQHHGLFSPIPYMRPVTILSVYTASWSLLTNPIHENRDHSICLCNTMVSSHQSHTWDHGPLCLSMQHHDLFSPIPYHTWDQRPLYLSMQHHGLFSPIPYMRPVTILSVYTASWSLLTNPIHENRDHSICLCNTMVSSHQSHTWEQGPLYLSIQHHGLFSPIICMRPGTTLSLYTTSWSLLTNYMHETRNNSICLYNTMVSSHQSHTWEQGPLYLSIQHHGLFSPTLFMRPWTTLSVYTTSWSLLTNPIPYMRPGTTLSVYATPWSLLTNPIHETSDHSICLYNIMVSSH